MDTTASSSPPVCIASSSASTAGAAAEELAAGLGSGPFALVLFFASSRYVPEELAREFARRVEAPMAGCTTAGEIGPRGYTTGGVVAVGFGGDRLRAHVFAVENVREIDLAVFDRWRREFDVVREDSGSPLESHGLGIVLADGLCGCEEHLIAALYDRFRPMHLVGASAGDDVQYRRTMVFSGGRALSSGLVFVAIETGGVPFRTFRLQDLQPVSEPLVVTKARVDRRHIVELEGRSAAEVYARLSGVDPGALDEEHFTAHSLMVTIAGSQYIRSVRRALPDGSLVLHSAIDEGVVVRIGRSEDTTASLQRFLADLEARGERPDLALCFDCLHRRWELERQQRIERVGELITRLPVAGFTTYGEIVDSLHVNQTMTGVLFGGSVRGETP